MTSLSRYTTSHIGVASKVSVQTVGRHPPEPATHTRSGSLEATFLSNYHYLLRFGRERGAGHNAEDLIQDLWLKARNEDAKRRGRGPIDDPRAFLCRMILNLIADHHRVRQRREDRDDLWSGCRSGEPSPLQLGTHVERDLIARDQLRDVMKRLNKLGTRTIGIFERFRIDGASQLEIALERGISVSGVEKHLQKCSRILNNIQRP